MRYCNFNKGGGYSAVTMNFRWNLFCHQGPISWYNSIFEQGAFKKEEMDKCLESHC